MSEITAPPVPAKGLLARFIGVIVSPKETFASVVASPKVVGMLLLGSLVMGLAQGIPQFTERGRQMQLSMQIQMAERGGREIPPQARENMARIQRITSYLTIPLTIISVTFICVLFALLYWAAFNVILGGTASFKQVLAVVAHSLPIGALGYAIGAPIMYSQGVLTIGGPFNLGMLVPMLDETSRVFRVLSNTNIFQIWSSLITGIGLGVLYKRSGLTIGLVLIAFTLAVGFGFSFLFS
jgi:hypothetical protein